jgi:hypothetical protein
VGGVAGFIGGGGVGALPGAATGAVGGAIGGAVTGGVSGFVNAIFADNAKEAFVGGVYWGGATGAAGGIIGGTARAGAAYTAGRAAGINALPRSARAVISQYPTRRAAQDSLRPLRELLHDPTLSGDAKSRVAFHFEHLEAAVESAKPFLPP